MTAVKSALPGRRVPFTDSNGFVTDPWYNYLQADHNRVGGNAVDKVDQASSTATAAETAAAAAQSATDGSSTFQALVNSGVNSACTITATDVGASVTVSISANVRYYGDGTHVSVNSGTVTAVPYDTFVYLFYDDTNRVGGAVTYHYSTDPSLATPTPIHQSRHYVGSVPTPAPLDPPNQGSPFFYAP